MKKIYKKLLIQLFKSPIHDSIKSAQWFENYDDPSSDKVLVTQSFLHCQNQWGIVSLQIETTTRHQSTQIDECMDVYFVSIRRHIAFAITRFSNWSSTMCLHVSTLLDWVTLISNTNQSYDVCSNLNVKRCNCLRL